MEEHFALLRSFAALIAVLEEHARALSLAIVDLRAEGNDAAAEALAKLERGHRTRIRQLHSEVNILMGDDEGPNGDS